jgi:hypothetical protein
MQRGDLVLAIPHLLGGDIGITPLKLILRRAGMTRAYWEKLWGW